MDILEGHWNCTINIDEIIKDADNQFVLEMNNLNKCAIEALCDGFLIMAENNESSVHNNDEELQLLIQANKELKHEIEIKLEDLSRQQTLYENFKQDQKLMKQEVKETHEAFLLARKQYKKCLNFYYTVNCKSSETQVIFVQFFTELKRNTDIYSVYLLRDNKTKHYKLQSVNPSFKTFKDFQRKLQETNDVPGVLSDIRILFINIRKNKDI